MNMTNTNLVYLNYRTTAISRPNMENSSKSDSLINIIKNNNIIYDTLIPQQTVMMKK